MVQVLELLRCSGVLGTFTAGSRDVCCGNGRVASRRHRDWATALQHCPHHPISECERAEQHNSSHRGMCRYLVMLKSWSLLIARDSNVLSIESVPSEVLLVLNTSKLRRLRVDSGY